MEHQLHLENDRQRNTGDGPPTGDNLDRQRSEIEGLLRVSDRTFDAINNMRAQDYLHQNLQTGGQ